MPPQRTRTRSWPAPSSGVGRFSTRRSPAAWMTRASMGFFLFMLISLLQIETAQQLLEVAGLAVHEGLERLAVHVGRLQVGTHQRVTECGILCRLAGRIAKVLHHSGRCPQRHPQATPSAHDEIDALFLEG